jgi:hypothetical protein
MSVGPSKPEWRELVEKLAAVEHERWAHWQRYLHEKGRIQADGSLLISADLVQRWRRQYETPFCNLSESEKESDREQVERYLNLIIEHVEKFLEKDNR